MIAEDTSSSTTIGSAHTTSAQCTSTSNQGEGLRTIKVVTAVQWVAKGNMKGIMQTRCSETKQHGGEEPLEDMSAHVADVSDANQALTRTT